MKITTRPSSLRICLLVLASAGLGMSLNTASGAVVLSSDFTNRVIATTSAAFTSTGDGSVNLVTGSTATSTVAFADNAATAGFLTPNINTDTTNEWVITIPFNLLVTSLQIQNVNLTGSMFSTNATLLQAAARDTDIRVSFVGSTTGTVVVGTQTVANTTTSNGAWTTSPTFTPASTLTLTNSETWNLRVETVNRSGSGNFTGLDSFTVNAIPEPTSFALAGLGLLALMAPRRRRNVAR